MKKIIAFEPEEKIGKFLMSIRMNRGLSLQEVALMSRIPADRMTTIEKSGEISMEELLKVLPIYQCSFHHFMHELDQYLSLN